MRTPQRSQLLAVFRPAGLRALPLCCAPLTRLLFLALSDRNFGSALSLAISSAAVIRFFVMG